MALDSASLLEYSGEHVAYEIQKFWLSWIRPDQLRTITAQPDQAAQFFNHALLESAALHARVLTNFLFPQRTYPGDVLAEHFCQRGAWDSTACPKTLAEVRKRTDTEVAHLTERRLSGLDPLKEWRDEPYLELLEQLERFSQTADARLHQNARDEITKARAMWAQWGPWYGPAYGPARASSVTETIGPMTFGKGTSRGGFYRRL